MKRILIAPLDWGLGHATRCIPVIRELLRHSCDVVLAGSGNSLHLLKEEFPQLTTVELPAYNPVYPRTGSMVWAMARQLFKFRTAIQKEHHVLEHLIREHRIDVVIADNRYGCWSKSVPSIFITHQSNILMPKRFGWLAPLVRFANNRMMSKFSACWIPDSPGSQSLAGDLISFGSKPNVQVEFIGNLSRFTYTGLPTKKYDVAAVFSGPEPQRSILDDIVTKQLRASNFRYCIVRGLPCAPDSDMQTKTSREVNFLSGSKLQEVLEQATVVIARSGYSTIMDLAALKCKAIFIPTPGQTEQEYLAHRLKEKGIVFYMTQAEFDLNKGISEAQHYSGFTGVHSGNHLLLKAISKLLTPV
ncbi:MAG: hypothetical protein JNM57_00835 [Cyclobacteriaceae bacterium]|nr:hypothetical protein [Cyclobacteriaceae bacterium]